jgi:hypothetical protein
LWEVTPEEVVGIWEWNYLQQTPNWFEDIVTEKVRKHRDMREMTWEEW